MSFTNLQYHLVFATRERRPQIRGEVAERLPGYVGGIARNLDCTMISANGGDDHLHVALLAPPTLSVADLVRTIKSNSSRWVHEQMGNAHFSWQDGYSAFSVSNSVMPRVKQYIDTQEEHHRNRSFTEELVALLEKHNIPYDERYLLG